MQDFSSVDRPESVKDLPPELSAGLVEASNAFTFDLWDRIRSQKGNLAFSPISISLALAMTSAGARGETATQMNRVLHLEGREAIHDAAATLLNGLNNPHQILYELRVVNRLFGDQTYDFDEDFQALAQDRYGAPLECVDFQNAPEPSRARINAWVEKQTAGRIRDLLSSGAVNELTKLILMNAVYFLGKWVNEFEAEDTYDAPFWTPDREIRVSTMHQTRVFRYCENGDLTVLEMMYKGGDLAMIILLSRDIDGIPALEERISATDIDRFLDQLRGQPVTVAIPKFKIDPADPIRLKSTLAAMGMPLAFGRNSADFTGIADPPDPQDRLCISDVIHKSFVKVDETGTEAAAATAVLAQSLSARPKTAREFRADHPFLFLIRDARSKTILFVGRVTDPRA